MRRRSGGRRGPAGYRQLPDLQRLAVPILRIVHLDSLFDLGGGAWKQAAQGVGDAQPRPRRTGHRQRLGPRQVVAGIHEHERHAAEVIPVQVRQQNRVDRRNVHVQVAHDGHRGGAAVHERPEGRVRDAWRRIDGEMKGRLPSAAAAEGITGAEEEDRCLHQGCGGPAFGWTRLPL